jgi:dihydrofolate reductase
LVIDIILKIVQRTFLTFQVRVGFRRRSHRIDSVNDRIVRKLKKEKGKEICVMGGGDLAKNLFEAGVIDEIGFNIHPVLLGSGIPLFHEMKRQIDLELVDCRQLKNGCVYVLYRVKN